MTGLKQGLGPGMKDQLNRFLAASSFMSAGGVFTDLDGTVVHEERGTVGIPVPVELALKELYDLGRPIVINTLRFPLSVIKTFGKEWCELAKAPIPVICLNGSQCGHIRQNEDGDLVFEETAAFPMVSDEVETLLGGIKQLIDAGLKDILLFYYSRDWRTGETIWTPVPERIEHVKQKYPSATAVSSIEFSKLYNRLRAEELCMTMLLIDAPEDQLMAYQHSSQYNFSTRKGVDKLSGAREFAARLGIKLDHSIGAGDTAMDTFLNGVGLALIVGQNYAPFIGQVETIKLRDSLELGDLLSEFAAIQRKALERGER